MLASSSELNINAEILAATTCKLSKLRSLAEMLLGSLPSEMLSVVDVQIYSRVFIVEVMELKVQSQVKKLLGGIFLRATGHLAIVVELVVIVVIVAVAVLAVVLCNITNITSLFLFCLLHLGS